eukprot:GFUD01077490.1.p1 GENE.GFUD01077490.1~~GFUD01077490.1.p1  ORF type:complete len:299 (-),score=85.50 GFUD01077490.1:572-1342(-)
MTDGEGELAYNLTVIYGMSVLSMVVLYKVLYPPQHSSPPPSPMVSSESLPSPQSTLALIKSRRSIMPKDLSGESLTREEVELVLEAANWAPTHHKTEPWRYTVVEGSDAINDYLDMMETWYSDNKEDISEADYDKFLMKLSGARSTWPQNVSHVVVIGMARQALPDKKLPEWEEICAVASSVQNLHLALTSIEGAGGFWSSHTWCRMFRDSQDMRDYLGLKDAEDRVLGAFVIGKVQEGKTFKGKRRDWMEKVTWK